MRQGGDGEGEGSGNSARPQNLEPSHTVVIVRRLLTFVKGTRAKLFRRCALSPTNRKVYFQFQCGPVVRERKIYSSNFGLDLIALGQSPASITCMLSSSSRSSNLRMCSPTGVCMAECVTQRL